MKVRLFGYVALGTAGWVAAATSLAAAAAVQASPAAAIVRLHVIANSDRQEDQRVKMEVARVVLLELAHLREEAPGPAREDADRFLSYLEQNESRLARAALALHVPVQVKTGVTYFPATTGPEGRIYPAGWYRAVRVVIGSGRGHNWWCVVFPSLCPVGPPDETALPSARAAPALREGAPVEPRAGGAAAPAPSGKAPPRPWWTWLLPWRWF